MMQRCATRRGYEGSWSRLVAGIGLVSLTLFGLGCGGSGAGEGESCETTADCKSGLTCTNGTCSSDNGDAGMDGGTEPTEEDYYISFSLEPATGGGNGRLMLYSTADGSLTQVSPDSVNCRGNCYLSEDLSRFVHWEQSGGESTIYSAQINEDMKASGQGELIKTGVTNPTPFGNYIGFLQQQGDDQQARIMPVDGSTEQTITSISDGWQILPDGDQDVTNDKLMVFETGSGAQTLNIQASTVGNIGTAETVTLGGSNFQEQSGSYFGSPFTASISPDGEIGAYLARGMPNNYQACEREQEADPYSSEDCGETYRCGTQETCVRLEVTVNLIDFDNADNLGTSCRQPGGCGEIHECNIPSTSQVDEARCIPGRVVLGVPQAPAQNGESGCQIVSGDDSIDFTSANGPLSWDNQNNLYLVGQLNRECLGDYDIPAGQVVKIDPTADEKGYEIVGGLGAMDKLDLNQCYDPETESIDVENCQPHISHAIVSPGGNEIAFAGTNPNISTPGLGSELLYLWRMLRDDSQRWFAGDAQTEPSNSISNLNVHSMN
jgi:hypothetical protein